jgi:hypothetical protein
MMARMRLQLTCLALVAACAHRASQPAVHVRLARDGEFPAKWNSTDWYWDDCALEGADDRQLYEPAIEYARRQFGREPPAIEVEPRNKIGRMVVWSVGNVFSDHYCVHVLEENGTQVLVLVLLFSAES